MKFRAQEKSFAGALQDKAGDGWEQELHCWLSVGVAQAALR